MRTKLVSAVILILAVAVTSVGQAQKQEPPKATHSTHIRPVSDVRYPSTEGLASGSEDAITTQKAKVTTDRPLEFKNSVDMRFRLIPVGGFYMGSHASETGRDVDEMRHRVTLTEDFYIGVTEVTQEQWEKVMGSNWDAGRLKPSAIITTSGVQLRTTGSDLPVIRASWNDCQQFIKMLCQLEGVPAGTYRLPTEAEWEIETVECRQPCWASSCARTCKAIAVLVQH